jgi:hypothetical protein
MIQLAARRRCRRGQSISGYLSDHAADVDLGRGKHGVIESMEPIAVESSPGHRVPMNLALVEAGGVFESKRPVVGVRIPKRLQEGVSIAGTGVSLAPVSASGATVGGAEGRRLGSVVFYGDVGVGSDVDELVKPEPNGFSEDAMLLSQASPHRLTYRVGLPGNARLVQAPDGLGAIDVVDDGSVIASVLAPAAYDASGALVPVSTTIEGRSLVLNVDPNPQSTEYPIMVDPVVDRFFTKEPGKGNDKTTNWHFTSAMNNPEFTAAETSGEWVMAVRATHYANEWGALEYTTQGESRIARFELGSGEGQGLSRYYVEDFMYIVSAKGEAEATIALPESFGTEGETVGGSANNSAEVLMTSTHAGEGSNGGGSLVLREGTVTITQNKGPEASIDSSHEYVDGGRRNVFYGSGSWIGPNSGGFEFHAHDPGVGIFEYSVKAESGSSSWERISQPA